MESAHVNVSIHAPVKARLGVVSNPKPDVKFQSTRP